MRLWEYEGKDIRYWVFKNKFEFIENIDIIYIVERFGKVSVFCFLFLVSLN